MFSRPLKIAVAVGVALCLLGVMVAVNSALSWRPIVINFPLALSTRYLPMIWKNNELWLLTREDFGLSPQQANAVRLLCFCDENFTDTSFEQLANKVHLQPWQKARNWNRAPLCIQHAAITDYSSATVGAFSDVAARSRYSSPEIEIWRKNKLLHVVAERPHRNGKHSMPVSLPSLLEFSPDGNRLVTDSSFYGRGIPGGAKTEFCPLGLAVFDVASGRQIVRQSAIEGGFTDFAWSPDSHEIAGITADGWVFILNARSGNLRTKFRAHQLFGAQIAWSPDGKTLVTATNPRLGYSRTCLRVYFKSGGDVSMGDGTKTVVVGKGTSKVVLVQKANSDITWNGQTERLLKRFDARTGKPIGAALPLQTGAVALAFSPDGEFLAVGEHNFALILDAAHLGTERRLTIPSEQQNRKPSVIEAPVCVAWSPKGTTLATSTWRGLTLWRMR
ncbi:hypothetical protein IAD21_03131 [Abditibacteriota bacterium]|nr:hypothetical protein IAD21_03131 [Abditibacteriota bacterium]